jgi:hypothetical protein
LLVGNDKVQRDYSRALDANQLISPVIGARVHMAPGRRVSPGVQLVDVEQSTAIKRQSGGEGISNNE